MTHLAKNLKYLRKQKNLTQQEFAGKLGLKRSKVGSYEEDRAEPRLETLQNIAHFFDVSLDELINRNIKEKGKNKADTKGENLRILPVTVDRQERETINLVPVKAAAGYLNGYADPEFIEELPQFSLPLDELATHRTYRAFQIKGDSMKPVEPGSYILCEYLQDWNKIKDGKCYVLITKDEGVVYKRVENELEEKQQLTLHSDNPEYDSYTVKADDILEVWKALGYISFELPDPYSHHQQLSMDQLTAAVLSVKKEVAELKKSR